MPRDIVTIRRRGGYFTPVPAGYQGIGNVGTTQGFTTLAYWGMRAYSAASLVAGGNVLRLIRASDNLGANFICDSSNSGFVNPTTVTSTFGANATQMAVLVEQVGNLGSFQPGSPTVASGFNPTWNNAGVSASIPTIDFASASNQSALASAVTVATQTQPTSWAAVAKHNTTSGSEQWMINDASANFGALGYRKTANNQIQMYAGTLNLVFTCSDAQYHSVIGVMNHGGTSTYYVDGVASSTATDPGVNVVTNGDQWSLGCYNSAGTSSPLAPIDGSFCEFALIAGALNSTQAAAIYANHTAAYGTFPI